MSNLLSLFEEFEEASAAQQAEIAIAVKVQVTVDVNVSADIKHPQILPVLSLGKPLGESARHTNAAARDVGERGRVWELRDDGQPSWLADRRPSRAVSRNRSIGRP